MASWPCAPLDDATPVITTFRKVTISLSESSGGAIRSVARSSARPPRSLSTRRSSAASEVIARRISGRKLRPRSTQSAPEEAADPVLIPRSFVISFRYLRQRTQHRPNPILRAGHEFMRYSQQLIGRQTHRLSARSLNLAKARTTSAREEN